MQIFLMLAGSGFFLLDLFVVITILFGPVLGRWLSGYGNHVFDTVPSAEITLLALCGSCAFTGFVFFILAFRQRRIAWESKEAHQDKDTKQPRKDSESRKALRDLEMKKAVRRDILMDVAAAGLLVLGLVSATLIFLTAIGRFPPAFSLSLWLMFMTSTLLGAVAAQLAQQEKVGQIRLLQKQFWDENRPAPRQAGSFRRRDRFRWRVTRRQVCYEGSATPRWTAVHRRRARLRW